MFTLEKENDKNIILELNVFFNHLNNDTFKGIIDYLYLKTKNKKFFLIINETIECTPINILIEARDYVKKYSDNFVIFSGNRYIKNLDNFDYYSYFLFFNKIKYNDNFNFFYNYKKNNLEKIKLFLSFNRFLREHRTAFVFFIKKNIKNHDYYLSIDKLPESSVCSSFNITNEDLSEIIKTSPFYIDIKNFKNNKADSFPIKYYLNSFFSHVNETHFEKKMLFLSEKIYKPIIMMHPFTVMGSPYILQELKRQGFEINFKGINNSYDLEENSHKRMLMIIDEIKKLDALTKNDLLDFYYQNKEILIFNKNKYIELNNNINKYNFVFSQKILDRIKHL